MSFEIIKHLLSKNETRPSNTEEVIVPPALLTEEPDKIRVQRNKFAKLSSRIKAN